MNFCERGRREEHAELANYGLPERGLAFASRSETIISLAEAYNAKHLLRVIAQIQNALVVPDDHIVPFNISLIVVHHKVDEGQNIPELDVLEVVVLPYNSPMRDALDNII
jgi:hypothetical protein